MQKFTEEPLIECALAEDGKVNTDLKFLLLSNYSINLKSIGLQGLLSILKIESESHANQNGREREVSEDEFSAFLGIYILMGIHKLPSIKS